MSKTKSKRSQSKRRQIPKNEMFFGMCDGSYKNGDLVSSYTIVSHRSRLVYQNAIMMKNKKTFSEYTELLAIRMLLENAVRLNIKNFEVVNDCLNAVTMINKSGKLYTGKGAKEKNKQLFVIRELMGKFEYVSIIHKVRKYTIYSDSLCRLKHRGISVDKAGGKVDLSKRVVVTGV